VIENTCPHCGGRANPEIEERVQSLVSILNESPGIYTFSSCGGHEEPNELQEEAGSFAVDFAVDIEKGGWGSLRRIAFTIGLVETGVAYVYFKEAIPKDYPQITIQAWWNGEEDGRGVMDFSLKGKLVDPDFLARTLDAVDRGEFSNHEREA